MTEPTRPKSLTELLARYHSWSIRETFERLADKAAAEGDADRAAALRSHVDGEPRVSAAEALAAQHEVSSLLAGWEWHTIRSAREDGASWADVAAATRGTPEDVRNAYLAQIDRAEEHSTVDDAEAYRRAAGDWTRELHAGTPSWARAQIEAAAGDPDRLAELRRTWWDPRTPPAPIREPPTPPPIADEPDPVEQARAAVAAVPTEVTPLDDGRDDQPAENTVEDAQELSW